MKNLILSLADRVLQGGSITCQEAEQLIDVSDDDTMLLLAMADRIRQKFTGDAVDCCAIINGRSGRCPENCKFCAQSAHYNTGVEDYSLLAEDEIVDAAKKAKAVGAVRFSIVTSGRGQSKADDFDNICKTLIRIREEVGIEICASLGILTEAGLRVCSGGIFGLNETAKQRVEMAFELKRLGIDSVPLNLLTPIPGTPFADNKTLTPLEILRAYAVFRFILPKALIRTAGGREVNLRDLQALALNGGLNGIMIGGYLTTGGRSTDADKQMIKDLGRKVTVPVL